MNKIAVDLQVPLRTLQVASIYALLSRVKRAEDVAILRFFGHESFTNSPFSY